MVVWDLFDPNILDVLNRYLRGLKRFYYNKKNASVPTPRLSEEKKNVSIKNS